MKIIETVQGSELWLSIRAKHFTASEAPVMMGVSKYKTRSELLHEKHTGIVPDIDAAKQRLFNAGHEAEEMARPLVEALLGEDLYPCVGMLEVEGLPLLASFDGITMAGDAAWETKLYNAKLCASVLMGELEPHYWAQLEQQMVVAGLDRVYFTCTDGTEGEMVGMWYESIPERREQLIAGWKQFASDLAAFVPIEVIPAAVAAPIMALPAVTIQVSGQLSLCNLSDVTPLFDKFLAGANTSLVTDDDFANGEATAKFSRATAKNLKLKAKEVVDQISSVSEAVRTLELYADAFNALGLKLEKLVVSEKQSRKAAISLDAMNLYIEHLCALEVEIDPIRMSIDSPDFAAAMKQKSTIASLQNAVNSALANHKIKADAMAKDIRAKLAWFKTSAAEYDFLFRDLQTIIHKPIDDLTLAVERRITDHKAAEAAKLEAERERIRAEEEAKAEAKGHASPGKVTTEKFDGDHPSPPCVDAQRCRDGRPTGAQIIEVVARDFGVSDSTAADWLVKLIKLGTNVYGWKSA